MNEPTAADPTLTPAAPVKVAPLTTAQAAMLKRVVERALLAAETLPPEIDARNAEVATAVLAPTLDGRQLQAAAQLVALGRLRQIEVSAVEAGEATFGFLLAGQPKAAAS